jgi:hypothetical protein
VQAIGAWVEMKAGGHAVAARLFIYIQLLRWAEMESGHMHCDQLLLQRCHAGAAPLITAVHKLCLAAALPLLLTLSSHGDCGQRRFSTSGDCGCRCSKLDILEVLKIGSTFALPIPAHAALCAARSC